MLFTVLVLGCSGGPPPEPAPAGTSSSSASSTSASAAAAAETRRWASEVLAGLRPGDAIRVEIWREPDLSGEFQVSNEGLVVFPLLGEREVRGVPAAELERQLVAAYGEYLENPSVDVSVLRRISILGEVRSPGLYPVDLTMSLNDALALAGGVAPSGNRDDIRLVREGRTVRASLDQTVSLASTPLESGDQVVVGQRSWLSRNLGIVSAGIGATATVLTALFIR